MSENKLCDSINYRGQTLNVNTEKVVRYKNSKGISFDETEIDVYVCCEYKKLYEDPLNHLDEIGKEALEEMIDKYISMEIEVGEYEKTEKIHYQG